MSKALRPSGFFYVLAGGGTAAAAIAGAFIYLDINFKEIFKNDPPVPVTDTGSLLVSGLKKDTDAFLADPANLNNQRAQLKNLCASLDTGINGALEKSGATSRFKFSFNPKPGSDSYRAGLCEVTFNGHYIAEYANTDRIDSPSEIAKLRKHIIEALPESDLRKLSAALPQILKPQ